MLIEYEYHNWLVNSALEFTAQYGSYRDLYEYLYSREYVPKIPRDRNRAEDGRQLRSRFYEQKPWLYGREMLDAQPCNMLELIVALALRCEENIMASPEDGDRTGLWIQTMIVSLGLVDEIDGYFDELHCCQVVDTFLAHKYKPNGEGGLFTTTTRKENMRRVEIWYQLNWYLDEIMNS